MASELSGIYFPLLYWTRRVIIGLRGLGVAGGLRLSNTEGAMRRRGLRGLLLSLAVLLLGSGAWAQSVPAPIRVAVDLQEAPRRIFHVKLTMPVKPGTQALLYPKWIPGEHAPDGPITDLVGLKFSAGGKTLPWRRDDVEMYEFYVDVPAGADSLEADYDYLSPTTGEGYSAGPTADQVIAVLEWNLVVLYPAGSTSDSLTYQASVRLPQGWKFGTALTVTSQQSDTIDFAPVSLTALVDSPVLTGQYFRTIALAPEVLPPHRLNIAADSPTALELTQEQIEPYSRLVREEGALFGARHYAHYDFLLSLTDYFFPNGLEHSQSSDERASEHMFQNADQNESYNSLLSHEFTHSWNGKYKRPAGLATPDYEQPMKGELLWIYEGLTQYIGEMIAVRAGLRTAEDYREELASVGAYLDNRPGRTWRSLEDTAVSAPSLYDVSTSNWASWRRGVDFYDEGWLIWLEADIIIRRESNGKKSLDDFCRKFFGPPNSDPKIVPYTLDEVVAAMNDVLPYDWRGFFHQRVDEINPHAPLGGIEDGGWHLVYNAEPNASIHARETVDQDLELGYSLGAEVHSGGGPEENGRLGDVIPGMPAAQAGLAPGMQIISVNGRGFSATALNDAIRASQGNNKPITVTASNGSFVHTYEISYHGGLLYPHLERKAAQADLLGGTLQALTGPAGQQSTLTPNK
jgi:predicted metalloprotease with PDZ domain